MQLHFYAVHTPIMPRYDLLQKYKNINAGKHHNNKPYAGLLENMDQTIGRLLDYLNDPNQDGNNDDSIANNTLVIFTSDNGGWDGPKGGMDNRPNPTINLPLRNRKGSFYEGGIRVPLIVWQPGTVPAGKQSDSLVHAVDFYPTFIEAAQAELPKNLVFDGTSFAQHATQGTAREREPIFYYFPGYLDGRSRPSNTCIKRIDGIDYKLIYSYDTQYTGTQGDNHPADLPIMKQPWELYDLTNDIAETTNLIANPPADKKQFYQTIAATMAKDTFKWLTQKTKGWEPLIMKDKKTNKPIPFPSNL